MFSSTHYAKFRFAIGFLTGSIIGKHEFWYSRLAFVKISFEGFGASAEPLMTLNAHILPLCSLWTDPVHTPGLRYTTRSEPQFLDHHDAYASPGTPGNHACHDINGADSTKHNSCLHAGVDPSVLGESR